MRRQGIVRYSLQCLESREIDWAHVHVCGMSAPSEARDCLQTTPSKNVLPFDGTGVSMHQTHQKIGLEIGLQTSVFKDRSLKIDVKKSLFTPLI